MKTLGFSALLIASVCCSALFAAPTTQPGPNQIPLIMVDQIGYLPDTTKIAIFADPQKGQNADHQYKPSGKFNVVSKDGKVVLSGEIKAWKNGETEALSGDKVWHADFSALKAPGEYYIIDPGTGMRSYNFVINDDAFKKVLIADMRSYYYQRCGIAISAKFGGAWFHDICHPSTKSAQPGKVDPPNGEWAKQPARDLAGGWHDAGDYNHYVPFTDNVLFNLMQAYEWSPKAFTDDTNIPESGNGVPDALDEIKYELDWLMKMQLPDGSVLNRMGEETYSNGGDDPASDKEQWVYTPPTTWSTATFASHMAHAARVYKAFDKQYPGYAKKCSDAAKKAWDYLQRHEKMEPANGQDGVKLAAAPGESDVKDDLRRRVKAAADLFALTGEKKYKEFFERYWNNPSETGTDAITEGHFGENSSLYMAEIIYAQAAGADPKIVETIRKTLKASADLLVDLHKNQSQAYLSWMPDGNYCWGSNQLKAAWGNFLVAAISMKVDPAKDQEYRNTAAAYLAYFHGVNPLNWCFVSNLGSLGAEHSSMEYYHSWFRDGSKRYDGPNTKPGPAPGFLVGGPNQFVTAKFMTPPYGEPPMKAYKDWNTGWNNEHKANEASWEVTEPAIYYQAQYTVLLSYFAQ